MLSTKSCQQRSLCPCQSGKAYADCCQPFISGKETPQTPEQLMRSRYTAYSQANVDYIAATMKGKAALGFDKLQAKQWASSVQWLGLNVISIPKSGQKDQGFVEFAARFKQDGKLQFIHEFSEFSLTNGQWFYVDGKPGKAPGRNDSCLCGSGKKFKKCCGG